MSLLYDGKEYFVLTHNERELIIEEPVHWDEVKNLFSEDEEGLYGYNVDYLTEDVRLLFEYHNGGDYLENIYDTLGPDETVYFEFGTLTGTTRNRVYRGTINLNTRERDNIGLSFNIETTSFESLLRTRYDTIVTINDSVTIDGKIDGTPLTQIVEYRNRLHTKEIIKVAEASLYDVPNPGVNVIGTQINDPVAWAITHIKIHTEEVTIDELQEFVSHPLGILFNTPIATSQYTFKAVERGLAQIYFAYTGTSFVVDFPNTISSGKVFCIVTDSGGVKFTDTRAIPGQFNYPFDGITWQVFLEPEDEVYIGFKFTHNLTNNATFGLDGMLNPMYSNVLRITQYTLYPSTYAKSFNLFDVTNQVIESITGIADSLISPFFDVDGAGYKFALQNGYAIRRFDLAERPLQTTLRNLVACMHAIWNVGTGFRTVNGKDFFVIMPMMDFNKEGVILQIKETSSYTEFHMKEVVFNEVNIGYEKYPEEDPNTIDEFNTEQEWILPIKTYKGKLVRKSPFPASGFLIEEQRREQFKEKPNDSAPNDDTIFIVPYVEEVIYRDIEFFTNNANSSITFDRSIGLFPGDEIIITGSTGVDGTYACTDVLGVFGSLYRYELSPAPLTTGSTVIGNVKINYESDDDIIYAERDENFVQINNILSNSSAYGLRISPKHNLYNFAPLLNIGLWFKAVTDKIVNTFAKNNGTLWTKFLPDEEHKLFVGEDLIIENAAVEIQDFAGGIRPYLPKGVKFNCVLTHEEISLLKAALRGETNSSKDYGRLLVTDDSGVVWYMKLIDIEYSPKTGVAAVTCAKIEPYS